MVSMKAATIASLVAAATTLGGFWRWYSHKEGTRLFKDHAFYDCLELDFGATQTRELGNEEIHDFSDLLGQIFFAGPRRICNGIARIRSRLPENGEFEEQMGYVLERLRAAKQWEPAIRYRDHAQEVGVLIRCGLVDFSPTKMTLRLATAK
jgi:hypothetical protein